MPLVEVSRTVRAHPTWPVLSFDKRFTAASVHAHQSLILGCRGTRADQQNSRAIEGHILFRRPQRPSSVGLHFLPGWAPKVKSVIYTLGTYIHTCWTYFFFNHCTLVSSNVRSESLQFTDAVLFFPRTLSFFVSHLVSRFFKSTSQSLNMVWQGRGFRASGCQFFFSSLQSSNFSFDQRCSKKRLNSSLITKVRVSYFSDIHSLWFGGCHTEVPWRAERLRSANTATRTIWVITNSPCIYR